MAEATKLPVKTEKASGPTLRSLRPFESLRREVDRLFEDFAGSILRSPFGRSFFDIGPAWRAMTTMPAVDVTETDKAFEIATELPGMDEKNANGSGAALEYSERGIRVNSICPGGIETMRWPK